MQLKHKQAKGMPRNNQSTDNKQNKNNKQTKRTKILVEKCRWCMDSVLQTKVRVITPYLTFTPPLLSLEFSTLQYDFHLCSHLVKHLNFLSNHWFSSIEHYISYQLFWH